MRCSGQLLFLLFCFYFLNAQIEKKNNNKNNLNDKLMNITSLLCREASTRFVSLALEMKFYNEINIPEIPSHPDVTSLMQKSSAFTATNRAAKAYNHFILMFIFLKFHIIITRNIKKYYLLNSKHTKREKRTQSRILRSLLWHK